MGRVLASLSAALMVSDEQKLHLGSQDQLEPRTVVKAPISGALPLLLSPTGGFHTLGIMVQALRVGARSARCRGDPAIWG